MDRAWMRRAIALAEAGWGQVHPNPLVGAVVVRDARAVGEGFHARYGGPHGEVAALEAAGPDAAGATLYVTLEPCSHYGKTPPCCARILESGVRRVVYGAEDANPQAGGGAAHLRAAGVDVLGGVEREAVRAQNAMFFHVQEKGSPFVALKYALSLDARLAEQAGRPSTVTGPAAQAEVQRLRAGFDAIMVGAGTVRADDPRLNVRGAIQPRTAPARVVVDTHATLPLDSRLAQTAGDTPVWLFCAEDAPRESQLGLERADVRVERVPRDAGGISLEAVLDRLWAAGVQSVFCEGGGRLGSALVAAGRVQRLYLFYAPVLYGQAGPAAFPGEPPRQAAGGWKLQQLRHFEDEALLVLDRAE
ncbi:MAG: bifunctional diaminohydroxyphosphoribosylaminopyrimidine deaminase/5-amino-6-(5-phosphoribosylamino)uracil reductase RibD [Gemmatimonadetes bacterium]|nr:bifunctional diaminohydroxyphosphoribosylaminopyrimidine deaminase/5-amino-6-(5-phosphoribosylamino)uracil reductase RibD [Gemmatimonadota bacterium]